MVLQGQRTALPEKVCVTHPTRLSRPPRHVAMGTKFLSPPGQWDCSSLVPNKERHLPCPTPTLEKEGIYMCLNQSRKEIFTSDHSFCSLAIKTD